MRKLRAPRDQGTVLTIIVAFTIMIMLIVLAVLRLGYNQVRLINTVGVKRTQAYYRAQAGVVDAYYRIRVDKAPPGSTGSFKTANFDPVYYYIDIDTNTAAAVKDSTSDVKIDIGPQDAVTKLRTITSTGFDGQ